MYLVLFQLKNFHHVNNFFALGLLYLTISFVTLELKVECSFKREAREAYFNDDVEVYGKISFDMCLFTVYGLLSFKRDVCQVKFICEAETNDGIQFQKRVILRKGRLLLLVKWSNSVMAGA